MQKTRLPYLYIFSTRPLGVKESREAPEKCILGGRGGGGPLSAPFEQGECALPKNQKWLHNPYRLSSLEWGQIKVST